MQSKTRVVETVTTSSADIWRGRDPAYPGVPQPPPELLTRSTSRATVDYETYVLAYAAQQRGHVLLLAAGVVILVGAGYYLSPPWLIIGGALAIGMILAGGAAFAIAADAHASYTRDLAIAVSETYDRTPPREPPPETVRPFVVAPGNRANRMNTGRLNFTPETWQAIFDLALSNDGAITRDRVAIRAGVPREWYHGPGWGRFLEELERLNFIDDRNRLTDVALAWYAEHIPLPLAAFSPRARSERTNGERTDTNDANEPAGGWEE